VVTVPKGLSPQCPPEGRFLLNRELNHRLWKHPDTMPRNTLGDLSTLAGRALKRLAYVRHDGLLFHLEVKIPRDRKLHVLDPTGNLEMLRQVFGPQEVIPICDRPVRPAGEVIQFLDANAPRSYVKKIPKRVIQIIDALGDRHPGGDIVLISFLGMVDELAKKSKHRDRIRTAHFFDVRGRNDLQSTPVRKVACHIVVGSPKTDERSRQDLALAVFGPEALPLPDLVTRVERVEADLPDELADFPGERARWERVYKAYDNATLQLIYDHLTTSELEQTIDRARLAIHADARVYVLSNEPLRKLWYAKVCLAEHLLDLSGRRRQDFADNYRTYEIKAVELLNKAGGVSNAAASRCLGLKRGTGHRYWLEFVRRHGESLSGKRTRRWNAVPSGPPANPVRRSTRGASPTTGVPAPADVAEVSEAHGQQHGEGDELTAR
jgi:hypothetical protein